MSTIVELPLLLVAVACVVALRGLVLFGDWLVSDTSDGRA